MRIFFDTSAFIKRYIEEPGSRLVETLCEKADDIAVSIVLPIECISAFSRLKREKQISFQTYDRFNEELFKDLRDITIIAVTPDIVGLSKRVLETAPLKALDAIHLACAIEYKPHYFISSDLQQITAAERSGLTVESVM